MDDEYRWKKQMLAKIIIINLTYQNSTDCKTSLLEVDNLVLKNNNKEHNGNDKHQQSLAFMR